MRWNAVSRGKRALLWAAVLPHSGIDCFPRSFALELLPCEDCIQKFTESRGISITRAFCVWNWRATYFPRTSATGSALDFHITAAAGRHESGCTEDVNLRFHDQGNNAKIHVVRQNGIKLESEIQSFAPLALPKILSKQHLDFRYCCLERFNHDEEENANLKRTKLILEDDIEARSSGAYSSSYTSDTVRNAAGTQKSPHLENSYTLNRQLSFLMKAGHLRESLRTFEQCLRSSSRLDSYTYLYLIKGYCEAGEVAKAQVLFRKLLSQDSRFDGSESFLYNVMIDGLGKAGKIIDAVKLVQDMMERGCLPDIYTYNSIICSLGRVGKVDDALAFFASMSRNGCLPDIITYNSLMSALGKAGRYIEAYILYGRMVESGCLPDRFTFNTLLAVLCSAGEVNIADSLFKFMKRVGCEPDVYTYTSMSVTLCRAGRVDEALQLSVEMTERRCAPNTATFNSWLDGLCKEERVSEAHLLFHKMLRAGYLPDKITYSILIHASCRTRKYLDQSFTLLKDLVKSNDHLDCRTSDIVFKSFEKAGMLKQAKRIARNARAKKCRFSRSSLA